MKAVVELQAEQRLKRVFFWSLRCFGNEVRPVDKPRLAACLIEG